MITDNLDERLTALPPAPEWPAAERAALLEQLLTTDVTPHSTDLRLITSRRPHRRRRSVSAIGVAATAAAAAVVIPSVLPSGAPGGPSPAAAAALHRLAHIAASAPAVVPGPGQYRHLVIQDVQSGLLGDGVSTKTGKKVETKGTTRHRVETWTTSDGRTWQRSYLTLPGIKPQTDTWRYRTKDRTVGLPTATEALRSYLRSHAEGSTSTDEAVFVAICDLLRDGSAAPKFRSAALQVLAETGHVSLGPATHDTMGRPVQEFDFVDQHGRPGEVQAVFFDPRTAQILQTLDDAQGLRFQEVVTSADIVNSVPADVLRNATPQ